MATKSSSKGGQKNEVDLMWVYRYLKDGMYPPGLNFMEKRMVRKRAERFCYLNGDLIYLGTPTDIELGKKTRKVLLTPEERWEKIAECHISQDGSHNGLEKTADAISADFYWNGIYKMIKDFIRQCQVCLDRHPRLAKSKFSNPDETFNDYEEEEDDDEGTEVAEPSPSTSVGKEGGKTFWEKVELRLLGPFKTSTASHHVLVAIDCYSLWPETHVLESPSESEIANSLMKLVCRYGKMERLFISQNETVLEPLLKKALIMLKKTDLTVPVSMFSQSNTDEACQRMCDVIEKFAKKYKTWPQNLEFCLLALRMSKNQNTAYTPSYLAHLRNISLPKTLTKKKADGGELSQQEQLAMIDRLMANQKSFSSPASPSLQPQSESNTNCSETPTPVSSHTSSKLIIEPSTGKSGYVTRSRTGNARPKALDEEEYETSTPRRRTVSVAVAESPKRAKRAKMDPESTTNKDSSLSSPSPFATKMVTTLAAHANSKPAASTDQLSNKHSTPVPSQIMKAATVSSAVNVVTVPLVPVSSVPVPTVITVPSQPDLSKASAVLKAAAAAVVSTRASSSMQKVPVMTEAQQVSPATKPALALALKSNPPVTPWEVTQEEASDSESTADESSKKVDLDKYYEAIKMYVEGAGYPNNASRSFKRLIRDQAKNYCVKGHLLFHEVGPKGQLKKIIMTKQERVKLLTETHNSTNSKVQMLSQLEDVHWKGKLIDCEAFLLARSVYEGELKGGKDNLRHLAEAKKLLQFDTFATYQEISNYLVYDVFSNDATAQRLANLKRQLKTFKVENGDLFHVAGNKKQAVLTSAPDRLKAISEAHLRKGTHADLTSTFNELSENYFWFSMKLDVKVFLNYCCTAATDNKHLLERYFLFREHFMREQDELDSALEGVSSGSMMEETPATPAVSKVTVELEPSVIVKGLNSSLPLSQASDIQPGLETSEVEVNTDDTVETDEDVTELVLVENDEVPAERPVETDNVGIPDDTPKVDPTATVTKLNSSEEVTRAAVESILMITGNSSSPVSYSDVDGSQLRIDGTQVSSESQTALEPGDEEVISHNETNDDSKRGTHEQGTGLEMLVDDDEDDDDDDSDEALYDSEEEDEEQDFYDKTGSSPGSPRGDKKVVKPRQHFKCSQCNKLFFGPLKFKMHMYKHTGQKPFPCNLCNKKYTNKKSLVIHQRTHTGELPYLCSLCGKRCPSKIALKSHLKCHDGNGGGFPAKCDVCGRVFSRKHLMERHKLHKHTNAQTEFKCTECTKTFSHQRSLKRHYMSSHMGVKNHVCGLCGKGFFRKEYLNGHLLQHGGEASEGIVRKSRPSSYKPRPSVFSSQYGLKHEDGQEIVVEKDDDGGVQRIILHQDENGELRVVDLATEREVKRMLESSNLTHSEDGSTTMVVHIEEPVSGEPQVVHVEHSDENVVEVPLEDQNYVEYETIDDDRPQEYVISANQVGSVGGNQYIYTSANGEITVQGNQELIYGQPAVQYEVECVGDVGDEEALSAINLLAQASAQQYETVISQI